MSTALLILVTILSVPSETELPKKPGPESTARNICRVHVRPDGQVAPQLQASVGWQTCHAFRWQIMEVNPRNEVGRPVSSTEQFKTGTRFRLKVETFTDLYIYMLNVNTDGSVVGLFPEEGERHVQVKRGGSAALPAGGHFKFAPPAGTEKFYVIASPVKLTWWDPAKVIRPGDKGLASKGLNDLKGRANLATKGKPLDAVLKTLRTNGNKGDKDKGIKDVDLVPPPIDGGQEVLHASARPNDEQPFMVEIQLKHGN